MWILRLVQILFYPGSSVPKSKWISQTKALDAETYLCGVEEEGKIFCTYSAYIETM